MREAVVGSHIAGRSQNEPPRSPRPGSAHPGQGGLTLRPVAPRSRVENVETLSQAQGRTVSAGGSEPGWVARARRALRLPGSSLSSLWPCSLSRLGTRLSPASLGGPSVPHGAQPRAPSVWRCPGGPGPASLRGQGPLAALQALQDASAAWPGQQLGTDALLTSVFVTRLAWRASPTLINSPHARGGCSSQADNDVRSRLVQVAGEGVSLQP